jgi:hypothetical protein
VCPSPHTEVMPPPLRPREAHARHATRSDYLVHRGWAQERTTTRLRLIDYLGRTALLRGRTPDMARLRAVREELRDRGRTLVELVR